MSSILLTADRKSPGLTTIGGDLQSHTRALEAIRDVLQIRERQTRDKLSSFVRVKELIDLGLVRVVGGNRIELAISGGSSGGSSTLAGLDDVDVSGAVDGDSLTYDATYGLWVPAAISGGGGGSGLVTSSTVTGSAATTITVSGLDLDSDLTYEIDFSFVNATSTDSDLRMFMNADTTTTNYDSQLYIADGGTLFAARQNTARITTLGGATDTPGYVRITLTRGADGKPVANTLGSRGTTSALFVFNGVWHWRTASTNVTDITFSSVTASTLAVGSYVRVYRY